MIIMGVALMALPIMAQGWGSQQAEQQKIQAAAPSATFQSTSAMKGSGSAYSANPMLNNDGTAAYSSASGSSSRNNGPRKAKKDGDPTPPGGNPFSGGGNDPETEDVNKPPVGDAVLPLMLMACVFCGVIAYRRRRSAA